MKKIASLVAVAAMTMGSMSAYAACDDVSREAFEWAANEASIATDKFGFGLPMWATMVDETGKVCHVYSTASSVPNTGASAGNSAWLGSRVISAQKANTANAFSLDGLAISTGALSVAVYPGGSLFGLQHSNPVDTAAAYGSIDDGTNLGTSSDPLAGTHIGGVNVFGGGVAIYNAAGVKVGAIGASGDTSCRDHTFAYTMRKRLELNNNPNDDGLVLLDPPVALFQQPTCGVNDPSGVVAGDAGDYGIRPVPVVAE